MLDYIRDAAEITRLSFAIVEREAKLGALPEDMRPVAARIVHACGMPDVAGDLEWSDEAVRIGREALRRGAPIVCDVRMVAAGLMAKRLAGNAIHVGIDEEGCEELAAKTGQTRSAAGIKLALARHPGAIVVIGNAPTALFRLIECVRGDGYKGQPYTTTSFSGGAKRRPENPGELTLGPRVALRAPENDGGKVSADLFPPEDNGGDETIAPPVLVLGFPVGFVGAAESKAALAASGLPFITLNGRRGGSAIAAAALNALILGGAE